MQQRIISAPSRINDVDFLEKPLGLSRGRLPRKWAFVAFAAIASLVSATAFANQEPSSNSVTLPSTSAVDGKYPQGLFVEEPNHQKTAPDSEELYTVAERGLLRYMAEGYKLPRAQAGQIVLHAVAVGRVQNVDPLLILSIAAIESGFDAKAVSKAGAKGLMQVHAPAHGPKFDRHGGKDSALEVRPNIEVGTSVLKRYLQTKRNVGLALKCYVGACNKASDGGYSRKILMERSRLELAAQGQVSKALRLLRNRQGGDSFSATMDLSQTYFDQFARYDFQVRRGQGVS